MITSWATPQIWEKNYPAGQLTQGAENFKSTLNTTINSFSHKQGRGSPLPTSVHATAS
jgi:hypothetical protein